MTTEAQIIANRRNAKKSTGPRTRKGKTAISQNAVKHGLRGLQTVISSESQDDFELYRDRMLSELAPAGSMESMLAERIVSLSWRLKRTNRIQAQTIDAMNTDITNNPLANLTQTFLLKMQRKSQPAPSVPESDLILGRMAIKDFSNARVLDRLLMYERRIEHSLFKTYLEFQRLSLTRKLDTDAVEFDYESLLKLKV